jgi:HEAT repeat protein
MQHLTAALKIRPGEGRAAGLLIGLMFVTSAGGSIGGNGIEALFFARFGVQFLPYLYMALSVVSLITSLSITALLGRVARERLYAVLPIVLALVLIGERALLALHQSWIYPALWLAMNIKGALQGLLTWGLAGLACDTRQAKRLFPLFSAGGILGAVVGGLATQSLAGALHSENLLLVWAGALLLAFLVSRSLVRGARARQPGRRKPARLVDEMQYGFQFVRRSQLMRWMSAAAVLLPVLFFSLTLPFSRAAAEQFPNPDNLAGFFGLFQGLSTAVAFLVSLFLANRLFARFGIMGMNLLYPIIYLAGFGVLAVSAAFPALVVIRFIQTAYLSGIAGTAYQAVFNVVPPERRDQTRTFIEGLPGQAGTLIAGLVLVVGAQTLQPQQLYLIGLFTAVLATVVLAQAARSYGGALTAALRAGQPQLFISEEEPFGGFQRDAAAVAAAIAGVSDPDPIVRRVSAEILGQLSAPEASRALVGLLKDADPFVRSSALRALAHARAHSALLDVAGCLFDPEPEVRRQAVDALRSLAEYPGGLTAHLRPLLKDADPTVGARAAAALLRLGPDVAARDLLRRLAVTGAIDARLAALQALGDWGDAEAFELVAVELEDKPAPPSIRQAAVAALMAINGRAERGVAAFIQALGDEDPGVRGASARALGQIGGPALEQVAAALSDPALEAGALQALDQIPARPVAPAQRDYTAKRVSRALHYYDLHGFWAAGGRSPADKSRQLLVDSLRAGAEREGLKALRATALLGERAPILLAIENLQSRNPVQRANALETLDSCREKQLIRPLLAVWETGEAARPAPAGSDWSSILLQDEDAWLRACAALNARGSEDPGVRARLAQLAQVDPDAFVRDTAQTSLKGIPTMETLSTLSVMERILFLRHVPLFADLSPADLKQVAAIAAERLFPDGATIAHQDEPGDEMYVIVSGEVRVMAGVEAGEEVARRMPGEYVGEMALLNRKPRMASLLAAGEVRLLCIDQAQFEGLLRERPETSLAVIRVLCERLESATTPRPSAAR